MKKLILSLSLVAAAFVSHAQEARPGEGKIFAGGTVGFSKVEDATTFSFSPSLGYFISDKIAVGGRLSFQTISDDGGSSFGIGGFGRYYMSFSDDNKFYGFGEAALGFASTKPPGEGAESYSSFGLGVAPGFGFYPGKQFAVEFTLPSVLSFGSSNEVSSFQLGGSTLAQPAALSVLFFIK